MSSAEKKPTNAIKMSSGEKKSTNPKMSSGKQSTNSLRKTNKEKNQIPKGKNAPFQPYSNTKKVSDNNMSNMLQKDKNSKNVFKEEIPVNKNSFKFKPKKSGDLLFNPKISKNKPIEPLFNKYEQLEGQTKYQDIKINEPIFKKTQEIFPSEMGYEMPYKSKMKQSEYGIYNKSKRYSYKNKSNLNLGANKKDESDKKQKEQIVKKYENKTYFSYKNNIKSDNPFKGPSKFEKSSKERKNKIAKTVEKEENEFYDIAVIEENILNKKELDEDEMNQLISKFNVIMYTDGTDNKEELKGYEFKINKISNIIKIMSNDEQNKVLTELKKNADNDNKNEIFEKLKNKIDEYNKNKNIKIRKFDAEDAEGDVYILKNKISYKKILKK